MQGGHRPPIYYPEVQMEIDLTWLTSLLSADELRALAWILATVIGVVHTAKVLMRYAVRELSMREIYGLSFVAALGAAHGAWPATSHVSELLPGLLGGPLANMLFWSVGSPLKKWVPWLWRMLQVERRRARPSAIPMVEQRANRSNQTGGTAKL